MRSLEITVAGVPLVPYFQRYLSLARPDTVEGELLTRPQFAGRPEDYFSELNVEDQFQVMEWQVGLQRSLHETLGARVSINVHNRMVESEVDRERFLSLASTLSAPSLFEFTETYPMPPRNASNRLLSRIRALGHATALDDFGTGLNGMSLLTDYDFDVIKLDRSLIFDLVNRASKRKTLRLMLEMLNVLGKSHVVEGVEAQEEYDILRGLGFQTFQGFLFDVPTRVEDLLAPTAQGVSS